MQNPPSPGAICAERGLGPSSAQNFGRGLSCLTFVGRVGDRAGARAGPDRPPLSESGPAHANLYRVRNPLQSEDEAFRAVLYIAAALIAILVIVAIVDVVF